jgi:hypothetical protein
MDAMCTSTMTNSAMASVRFTSAVGVRTISYTLPSPKSSKRLQIKMKTKRVMASGTMYIPRSPIVPWTWRVTMLMPVSNASCNRPGTPLVTCRRSMIPRTTTTSMAMPVAQIVSRLKVRPPTLRV